MKMGKLGQAAIPFAVAGSRSRRPSGGRTPARIWPQLSATRRPWDEVAAARLRAYSCIVKIRKIETVFGGKPTTPFMKFGDAIEIKMKDKCDHSIFGAVSQKVAKYERQG